MEPKPSKTKKVILFWGFFLWLSGIPAHAHSVPSTSSIIFQAMEEEMDRSLNQLKIDIFDPPYFVKYQIRHNRHIKIAGSFGSLIQSDDFQNRTLFVDVRIGDSKFDSSTPGSHRHNVDQTLPLDDDLYVLKRAIWYETDLRYKQAIMNFMRKKGRFISGVATHETHDYSRGHEPVSLLSPIPDFHPDMEAWNDRVRNVSALFKQAHLRGMQQKLGLEAGSADDESLVEDLLTLMATEELDFTLTFRRLSDLAGPADASRVHVSKLFEFPRAFDSWLDRWNARIAMESKGATQRQREMDVANPVFIPRNHLVEEAIDAAMAEGELGAFHKLVDVLARPHEFKSEQEVFATPPRPEQVVHETFCGT